MTSLLVSAFFNIVGVIVFGSCIHVGDSLDLPNEDTTQTYDVGWSYILCAVAACASTITGFLLAVEFLKFRTSFLDTSSNGGPARLDPTVSTVQGFPQFPINTADLTAEHEPDKV